jgi:hypothetical protein
MSLFIEMWSPSTKARENEQADKRKQEFDFLRQKEEMKIDYGKKGQNDGHQQEQTAGRREFAEDTGKEVAENLERPRPGAFAMTWMFADVLFVETRTLTGLNFELRPEFVDLHPGGKAIPAGLRMQKCAADGHTYGIEPALDLGAD